MAAIETASPAIKAPITLNKQHNVFKRMLFQWDLQLLILPGILFIFVFMYIPMYGMLMAFQNYQLGDMPGFSDWAGLEYFRQLMADPFFPRAVRNTIVMSLLRIFIGFPMPIIFALILNEVRISKFKKPVQTISYLPHFISWVVAATLLFDILDYDNGVINNGLLALGLIDRPIYFFGRSELFWGLATVTDIWKTIGWNAIIFIAAITSVDPELHEAAAIDGASRLQRIWYITLQCIMPTIIILFIFTIGSLLTSNFDQVFMLTRQMGNTILLEHADVIDTYIMRVGLRGMRYSFAAAAGFIRTIVNFSLVLFANWLANRYGGRGLF
ncbi:MAG: ABC transporter permease subunit [Oscillospiraceae bacterium]|nr:ABC transporter permease subunit [Oscillospiraceae bacterium]